MKTPAPLNGERGLLMNLAHRMEESSLLMNTLASSDGERGPAFE